MGLTSKHVLVFVLIYSFMFVYSIQIHFCPLFGFKGTLLDIYVLYFFQGAQANGGLGGSTHAKFD